MAVLPEQARHRAAPDRAAKTAGNGTCVSTMISVYTPQREPLAAIDSSRRWAASVKLAGKLAITRNRNGSAISPASRLYSSMFWNSLRRYFWITFSMCSDRSASRCSICRGSVQMRLVTSDSLIVGQVHEGGEVFAQPDRIDDREADLARRDARQQPQHDGLHGVDRHATAFAARLEQD